MASALAIVAMLGVCALMGLKVMGVKEFRAKVNWDILIYIGCMYEIGSALTTWVLQNGSAAF